MKTKFVKALFKKIYISLWTNYNSRNSSSNFYRNVFTFHYELIITTSFRRYSNLRFIYISLWTNYNLIFKKNALDKMKIYISLWTNYNFILITFLFLHSFIYISLWTNYNYPLFTNNNHKIWIYISLWTNYNL